MLLILFVLYSFASAVARPLDVEGAAEYLNTTKRHIREMVYRRELPFTKVGRLLRFLPADLDAYLAARRVDMRAS